MFGFILLAPSLASASKFSTNCTIPAESTTIVSSANIRGTFDILRSGLFTIFICIWTRTHAFYAEMGGFVIRPYGNQRPEVRHVATADIMELRRNGFLETLSTITADRLNDMSNGDAFTKAAAVGNFSWMVIQVIMRAAKGLPITQLEITACELAASTFLTYLIW